MDELARTRRDGEHAPLRTSGLPAAWQGLDSQCPFDSGTEAGSIPAVFNRDFERDSTLRLQIMSKKDEKTALDPLAMVQSLDVDVLESRVAQIESEIAEYTAGRQRELDALRTLLKAARIARDGKPPRKQRQPKQRKEATTTGRHVVTDEDGMNRFGGRPSLEQRKELADQIESLLVELGAAQPAVISERLRYSESVIASTLAMFPDRFTKKHAGYWSQA